MFILVRPRIIIIFKTTYYVYDKKDKTARKKGHIKIDFDLDIIRYYDYNKSVLVLQRYFI